MKFVFTNIKVVIIFSIIFGLLSLIFSIKNKDVEWFQASGAIITIAGVILASRKIIRLGIKNYIKDEQTIDCGHIVPTPEEIEYDKQFNEDIKSYHMSIWLLVIGTFIWAYGGIILRYLNLVSQT